MSKQVTAGIGADVIGADVARKERLAAQAQLAQGHCFNSKQQQ